ncbi:MAG: L,D-transpeptidase family protein [Actinomycetes bacterium]
MHRRIAGLTVTPLLVAALLAGCSSGEQAANTTTTTMLLGSVDPSVQMASGGEITSPEATPVEIDAPDNVIPPEPTAPADEFAVGKETPRDPKVRPFLSPGDEGDDVVALQRRLIALSQRVDDSGLYDDATLAAVLNFQRSQGLVTDGIVGTKTWRALDNPRPVTAGGAPTPPNPVGDGAAIPSLDPPKNDPAEIADSKVTGAIITLSQQKVVLLAGSRPVAEFLISSGRNGLTPVGTFRVQSKSPRTVSNSDSSIGMKWMTRFNGGIGFHGIPVKNGQQLPTPLGQRPVSAGCIRMKDDDAKAMFDRLPIGATVVVAA